MKILATADLHIRNTRTRALRADFDPFEFSISQISELILIAKDENVDAIVIAGDLFHRPTSVSIEQLMMLSVVLIKAHCPVHIIPGNHDVFNYDFTSLGNTHFGLLLFSGVISLPESYNSCNRFESYNNKDILVLHEFISDRFIPNANYSEPEEIMERYPNYPLIISGDNHVPFVFSLHDRVLINCGSLTKFHIDQYYYQPSVWVVDSNNPNSYKKKYLNAPDPKEMFRYSPEDYEESKKIIHDNVDTERLIELFEINKSKLLTFTDLCDKLITNKDIERKILQWQS